MSDGYEDFQVARSLRVPGLGLLVLPAAPVPPWLLALPLQAALRLQLYREQEAPVVVLATTEEVAFEQETTRALLLDVT